MRRFAICPLLLIVDQICVRATASSPYRAMRELALRLGRLGPALDPAEQFARLRLLLPTHAVVLGPGGAFVLADRRYKEVDEGVLRYFAGSSAIIPHCVCPLAGSSSFRERPLTEN